MDTRSRVLCWCLPLAFLLVAGGLRHWKLDWSFANDEIATLYEVDSLFDKPATEDKKTQTDRLPRAVPLSYALHGLGYKIFGRDESGSRMICVILGALGVAAVYTLLRGTLGTFGATTTALLVLLWPDHLFHSQQNRFYMIAWFFGALTMLLGARALKERSPRFAVLAGVAGLLAVLAHTVVGAIVAALPVALLAGLLFERRRAPDAPPADLRRIVGPPAIALLLVLAVLAFYVRPLMRGWNAGEAWYGTGRSILATANSIGWPVALCSLPGMAIALRWRDGQGLYWLTFVGVLGVAVVSLPRFMTYHPHYAFPLALPVFVCVGFLVEWIAGRAREGGLRLLPWATVFAVSLFDLPSSLSYFRDGSRDDYRGVARYLAKNRQPGDRILAHSAGLFEFYAPEIAPIRPLREWPLEEVRRFAAEPGRCWIIVRTNRAGVPEPFRAWLGEHCRWSQLATVPRLDYSDYRIYVFLHEEGR